MSRPPFIPVTRKISEKEARLPAIQRDLKKARSTAFGGLSLNQKRTSNQLSESPPLPNSARRLQEQRGLFLITAWSCTLITNSDKICINICILGSHLSHKENRKMFTLHKREPHPFGDKTTGEILSISPATENAKVKQRGVPTIQFYKDQAIRQ